VFSQLPFSLDGVLEALCSLVLILKLKSLPGGDFLRCMQSGGAVVNDFNPDEEAKHLAQLRSAAKSRRQ